MKTIYSKPQKSKIKISKKIFNNLITKIVELTNLNIKSDQIISISFVGPRTITRINRTFVGHTGITDVISFDYRNDDIMDNDVAIELIICINKAEAEASLRSETYFAKELTLYIVHGILHMTGFDDLTPEDRILMRREEKKVMLQLEKAFNFNDIFTLTKS
ncbi:MAG TPA: rRNA maturation RNase YbeY [Victivallales bacterium]|nr:rRNA maturation RNase YbeY [Victivallales bacterium]